MNRVVHFEINATDPERAARFYCDVFGWDIKEWAVPGIEVSQQDRYWLVSTGPGDAPGSGYVNAVTSRAAFPWPWRRHLPHEHC